jgi:hypothetical protein
VIDCTANRPEVGRNYGEDSNVGCKQNPEHPTTPVSQVQIDGMQQTIRAYLLKPEIT